MLKDVQARLGSDEGSDEFYVATEWIDASEREDERMCIYEICPLMVGDEWPDCKTCPYADGTEGDERMTARSDRRHLR